MRNSTSASFVASGLLLSEKTMVMGEAKFASDTISALPSASDIPKACICSDSTGAITKSASDEKKYGL